MCVSEKEVTEAYATVLISDRLNCLAIYKQKKEIFSSLPRDYPVQHACFEKVLVRTVFYLF